MVQAAFDPPWIGIVPARRTVFGEIFLQVLVKGVPIVQDALDPSGSE